MWKEYVYFKYNNGEQEAVPWCDWFWTNECTNESIKWHIIFIFQSDIKQNIIDMLKHEGNHLLSYEYLAPRLLFDYKHDAWYQKWIFNIIKAENFSKKLVKKIKCELPESFLSKWTDFKSQIFQLQKAWENINEIVWDMISLHKRVLSILLDLKVKIDNSEFIDLQDVYNEIDAEGSKIMNSVFLPIKWEIVKRIRIYYTKVKSIDLLLSKARQDKAKEIVAKMRHLHHEDLVGEVSMYKHKWSLVFGFSDKIDLLSAREGVKIFEQELPKKDIFRSSVSNKIDSITQNDISISGDDQLFLQECIIQWAKEITAYMKDGTTKNRLYALLFNWWNSYDYFKIYKTKNSLLYKRLTEIYNKLMKIYIDHAYALDEAWVMHVPELLGTFPEGFRKRLKKS